MLLTHTLNITEPLAGVDVITELIYMSDTEMLFHVII